MTRHRLLNGFLVVFMQTAAMASDVAQRDDFAARAFGIDERCDRVLSIDNDEFGDRRDRWFTSGVAIRGLSPARATPFLETEWADSWLGHAPRRLEMTIGQHIYSPENLRTTLRDTTDRPYAGWSYLGFEAVTLKPNQSLMGQEALVEDRVGFQLGVVGPAALAETTQGWIHSLNGTARPAGWANQLRNEPGLNLMAQRRWHIFGDALGHETAIVPHVAAVVGTVNTHAEAGFEFRLGEDLHYDLNNPFMLDGVRGGGFFNPPDGLSWYLTAGARARVVAHNLFLDGSVFADGGHSVDKKPLMTEAHIGFGYTFHGFRFGYSYVWRSAEFDGQSEGQGIGSVVMSWNTRF